MTDSQEPESKSRRNVNPEAFERLLGFLSSDPEEAGRLYMNLHQKLTGYLRMLGVSDPASAADETIDQAALNISAGAVVPDVERYCRGIARNIAHEKLRTLGKEAAAFRKFVEDLGNSCAEQVERIYNVLKPCFEQLADDEQKLLMAYCQVARGRARAEHRREVAETLKITAVALRVRVTRLRNSLTDCVRKRSNRT